jgi:hypothetical protein
VNKEKDSQDSFAIISQTAKATATGWDKYFVK